MRHPWILLLSISLLLTSVLATPQNEHHSVKDGAGTVFELEELRARLAKLESVLHDDTKILESRMCHLDKKAQLVEEMELNIRSLKDSLDKTKLLPESLSYFQEKANDMEEKIKLLWVESRKNNFDIHVLETRVQDANKKIDSVSSQVQKMKDIVTEQWIQIRHLEQALQITKVRTLTARRETKSTKCVFMKFFVDFHQHHLPKCFDQLGLTFSKDRESITGSYMSNILHHFKKMTSYVQQYHHELQISVRKAMESNKYMATMANKEVIFFLASAIVVFPLLPIFHLVTR